MLLEYKRSFSAILWLQCMAHLILFAILNIFYFHITTFPRICALPSMAAVRNSSMSCFPGMLLRYFLNILEMVPVDPTIIGIYYFQISHQL